MNDFQQTISSSKSISGVGLHTGKKATIKLVPAPINYGIKFKRVDLLDSVLIDANVDNVVISERNTIIQKNDIRICTTEHLLSALAGLQIDNLTIEIDNEEVPILDGSAKHFVELIKECGIEKQNEKKNVYVIDEVINYKDSENNSNITILPSDKFKITVMVDYKSNKMAPQYATLDDLADYEAEIANSRTFVFFRELENLVNKNLIKGGDVDNAIVIVDNNPSEEEIIRVSNLFDKKDVKINENGLLNTIELNHKNELARHKLLDLIGDLLLIGNPIKGHIIATFPGHKINGEVSKILRKKIKDSKFNVKAPYYNNDDVPIYDIHKIKSILPHRYPFLLVDKVIEISETTVVGIKNVTANESFFPGHFPDNHVMPGVLQIEAMAQCGGMLALQSIEDTSLYDVFFLKINNTKFRRKVVPGDTMIMKLELLSPIRRGIVEMKGTVYIGNNIATESEMMASIIKRK